MKPITNNGKNTIYIGSKAIPPGETRLIAESELPPHLRTRPTVEPAVVEEDALLALLDNSVRVVIDKINDRDDSGQLVISDEDLQRLIAAETAGKTRKSLMAAFQEETLTRVNEKLDAETRPDAEALSE